MADLAQLAALAENEARLNSGDRGQVYATLAVAASIVNATDRIEKALSDMTSAIERIERSMP